MHVIWDIPHLFPLCDLASGSFEALERFSIESRKIKRPPRLREVAICIRDDGAQEDILGLFHIPWNQLTHLTLEENFSLKDCHDIMLQCVEMRSIKIYTCVWDGPSLSPASTGIVLPTLETLEFRSMQGFVEASIGHFFTCLALPALKSLELSVDSDKETVIMWDVGLFSKFQGRSPNIERIMLRADRERVHAGGLIALL
jgi:hypothetical protein